MEATTASRPGAIGALRPLAVVAAGVAAGLVLVGPRVGAGIAVVVAAITLAAGDAVAQAAPAPRARFAASVSANVVDAAILGSVTWVMLETSVWAGVAAITALAAAFVASYLLVKGLGMGFQLTRWPWSQPLRLAAVAVALLTPFPQPGLWVAAAIGVGEALVHAVRLARQEEPA